MSSMGFENKLGLGTVQFGLNYGISNSDGKTSTSEVQKILNFALQCGIDVLDSAAAYGNAEEVIGNNDISSFNIISKFRPSVDGESVEYQLETSLNHLKCSSIYAYLAHSPQGLLQSPEEWNQLKRLKQEGKVDKIGYSLNQPQEIDDLLELNFIPDIVQLPYNYFDRRFEDKFKRLKELECEIHSRSAFFQGLFFVNTEQLDEFFDPIKNDLIDLQNQPSFSSGSLLKFVLENSYIDKVIIGVESEQQLRSNIDNIEIAQSLPEFDKLINPEILTPSNWPKK